MAEEPKQQRFDTQIQVEALVPGRGTFVATPWGDMALYRAEGEVFCAQAFCPHLEGPLFEGSQAGTVVTCPWHQWRFDLHSGRRVDLIGRALAPACALVRLSVHVAVDGRIWIEPANGAI